MADKPNDKIRYRVLKQCYVNDTLLTPVSGKERDPKHELVIAAAPGLAGPALEEIKGFVQPKSTAA